MIFYSYEAFERINALFSHSDSLSRTLLKEVSIVKSKSLNQTAKSLSDINISKDATYDALVRAFEYMLVHWLVTEVDPFDVSVWCKNGSAKNFITFEVLTCKFLVRNDSSQLSSTEIVLGVQEVSEFDSRHDRTLEAFGDLPVDWEPEDLEAYLEDVFYYWRNHFSLRTLLFNTLHSLDHETRKAVIESILLKSVGLVDSVGHESVEACILDFQAMDYGLNSGAYGVPVFH